MVPTYSNNVEIYDNYRAPSKLMRFEGHVYRFISAERRADVSVHHYRCEIEQHNLRIHLQDGVPFYVEGTYQIAS